MAEIPTMTGTVTADQLGIVLLHEYLLFGLHGWQYAPEVKYDRAAAYDQLRSSLEQFKKAGGKTIVDASGITLGRNVTLYAELAQATGVQIVGTTGFGNQSESIPGHFYAYSSLYRKTSDPHQHHWHREVSGHFYPSHGGTKDYLMFLFYNELTEGMAAPGMIRSKIPAGMVKAATSWNEITAIEDLSLRGAAMAAKRARVAVYTDCINQAQKQMEILLEEGLEPERIVIGNCDDGRDIDLRRDKRIARKGAYVAYDHIGWEDASFPYSIPDGRRVELVKNMVKTGYTEHIVLSASAIGYALGAAQPGHSFTYLLKNFVPKLKKAGVNENDINTILVENPKRILSST